MEVVIFPEMITAGEEAFREGKSSGLDDAQICLVIYLAMEAVREIALLRTTTETVH